MLIEQTDIEEQELEIEAQDDEPATADVDPEEYAKKLHRSGCRGGCM